MTMVILHRYQVLILIITCFLGTCLIILQTVLSNDSRDRRIVSNRKRPEINNIPGIEGRSFHRDLKSERLQYVQKILKQISDHHQQLLNESENDAPPVYSINKWSEFKAQHNQTKNFLSGFNYRNLLQTFNPLLGIPVIKDTSKVKYLLISTYFRTGSSFTGDLLQQNWKTFYSYEPLHYTQIQKHLDDKYDDEAIDLLDHIYRCDFAPLSNYIRWVKKVGNRYLFKWNRFLWSLCNIRRPTCFDPKNIAQTCVRAPYRIIKTTRLSLRTVEKLMDKLNGTIDLKVIYLVRDPRAILNSRQKLSWCTNSSCSDIDTICSEMKSDISVYKRLHDKYGDRVMAVRHEDLSLQPLKVSTKLFNMLEVPLSKRAQRFLRQNTEAKMKPNSTVDPYSVKRISKEVVFKWTKGLNLTVIKNVQESCGTVFDDLGYKLISSSKDMEMMDAEKHLMKNLLPSAVY
ncbi:carbohydrate sulfotransferase 1-like [Brevipalpus obovatus]|uniref:carbohydrate sulfotransferase 1-like n=1 Tax=Brevipalpus obovatus TaxID=246614 RepID=UPI003D9E3C53